MARRWRLPAETLRRRRAAWLVVLLALAVAAPASAMRGAMTVPRNLEQLTDRASDIVRGTVVEARVEKHPELTALDTVVVTLRVKRTLKGAAPGKFTFRQYIWDARDRFDAAGYRKGQDLLLLMIAPSRHGLSSPAGMDQGRFRIVRDPSGREMAINGAGNARLLEGLANGGERKVALTAQQADLVTRHRGGAIAASDLEALIRAFAGAR